MDIQEVLPRDAIRSIDEPSFGRAYFGDPDDTVLVVDGETPRAYPIRILSHHEIVNDVVGDSPLAVTWCPICWSGVVYERTVGDWVLTFGVSGKLADDTLVLYDRETDSEWKQSSGACIAGELTGERLTVRSAPMITFRRFRSEYPDGTVLQPVRGAGSDAAARGAYDMAPYEEYADGDRFGLYGMRGEGEPRTWDRDDISAKTVVLGVEFDDEATGYPLPAIETAGTVVTDTVGGTDIVVFATGDGGHAFENPGLEFEVVDGTIHADGTTWNEITGESDDGRRLDRVPARRLFAFTWRDDHGDDAFYEG